MQTDFRDQHKFSDFSTWRKWPPMIASMQCIMGNTGSLNGSLNGPILDDFWQKNSKMKAYFLPKVIPRRSVETRCRHLTPCAGIPMFWSSWKISLTEFSDVWLTAKTADNGLSGMMLLGWRYSLPKADILAQLRTKLGSDSDHTRQYYWVTSFQHPHRQDHVKGTQQQQRNWAYLVRYMRNALAS